MVASPEAWAEPFLNQAREDLRAAWTIDRSEAASTFCMLMQMVFEKLAKAAYARSGNHIPRPTEFPVTSSLSSKDIQRVVKILRRTPKSWALLWSWNWPIRRQPDCSRNRSLNWNILGKTRRRVRFFTLLEICRWRS